MSFFSSWIIVIFTIALAFPLYSEAFISEPKRKPPDCDKYKDLLPMCTRELDPVCGLNDETYGNPCLFCSAVLDSKPFGFNHYGECNP